MPRILVEMLEGIAAATRGRIDFFHIPVPKDRTDDAYYAPLKAWKRQAGTKLYLGLLHHDDDAGDKNAHRRRDGSSSTISGSRPNAAGAEPSRAGCPACSKVIVLLRRHSDG